MPKLYNVDHQPAVLDHDLPAVMPGESHEFTDEQIEAGLTGSWSEEDPRAGLEAEKAFKKRRDAKQDAEKSAETHPDPAESGDKE